MLAGRSRRMNKDAVSKHREGSQAQQPGEKRVSCSVGPALVISDILLWVYQ